MQSVVVCTHFVRARGAICPLLCSILLPSEGKHGIADMHKKDRCYTAIACSTAVLIKFEAAIKQHKENDEYHPPVDRDTLSDGVILDWLETVVGSNNESGLDATQLEELKRIHEGLEKAKTKKVTTVHCTT